MRVLLDACVPKGLRKSLLDHETRTAPEMGWGDLDNGDLLDAMEGHFEPLVTVDRRLPDQQRIKDRPFGVVGRRRRCLLIRRGIPRCHACSLLEFIPRGALVPRSCGSSRRHADATGRT
jgi:hypothetical protein